jgi:MobA-like NTP transferase domain
MGVPSTDITGLVLAGEGGKPHGWRCDKGLQSKGGRPLAQHALMRLLRQVGQAIINANQNLDVYRCMGVSIWPDEVPDYPGPLAGMLSGLSITLAPVDRTGHIRSRLSCSKIRLRPPVLSTPVFVPLRSSLVPEACRRA